MLKVNVFTVVYGINYETSKPYSCAICGKDIKKGEKAIGFGSITGPFLHSDSMDCDRTIRLTKQTGGA